MRFKAISTPTFCRTEMLDLRPGQSGNFVVESAQALEVSVHSKVRQVVRSRLLSGDHIVYITLDRDSAYREPETVFTLLVPAEVTSDHIKGDLFVVKERAHDEFKSAMAIECDDFTSDMTEEYAEFMSDIAAEYAKVKFDMAAEYDIFMSSMTAEFIDVGKRDSAKENRQEEYPPLASERYPYSVRFTDTKRGQTKPSYEPSSEGLGREPRAYPQSRPRQADDFVEFRHTEEPGMHNSDDNIRRHRERHRHQMRDEDPYYEDEPTTRSYSHEQPAPPPTEPSHRRDPKPAASSKPQSQKPSEEKKHSSRPKERESSSRHKEKESSRRPKERESSSKPKEKESSSKPKESESSRTKDRKSSSKPKSEPSSKPQPQMPPKEVFKPWWTIKDSSYTHAEFIKERRFRNYGSHPQEAQWREMDASCDTKKYNFVEFVIIIAEYWRGKQPRLAHNGWWFAYPYKEDPEAEVEEAD